VPLTPRWIAEIRPLRWRGRGNRGDRTCSLHRAFFPWLRTAGCSTSFRRLPCNCNWDARTSCYLPLVAPFLCGEVPSLPAALRDLAASANNWIIVLLKTGMSSGWRLLTQFLSRTTSSFSSCRRHCEYRLEPCSSSRGAVP